MNFSKRHTIMQTPGTAGGMNRRKMIKGTALAVAALTGEALPRTVAAEKPRDDTAMDALIDTHVYLSRWPYRRVPGDETPDLVRQLRQRGVTSAWVLKTDAKTRAADTTTRVEVMK